MFEWWKNPVLQGEDNDYGDYDYLIEEIPENSRNLSNYYQKCEECGKYHHFNYTYISYFRTMDGYDSMDYTRCVKCEFLALIHQKRNLIRHKLETKRWKFFSKNKYGKKLTEAAFKLYEKNPNSRFCQKLAMDTLPF